MRLGRIPWINCYPVYGAADRGIVAMPAESVSGTAAELNDLLACVNEHARRSEPPGPPEARG